MPLNQGQSKPPMSGYPVSERGRKSRSADFPVRSIGRTPTCTQFAARSCERSFLRTGKSALRPPSLTGYPPLQVLVARCCSSVYKKAIAYAGAATHFILQLHLRPGGAQGSERG